MLLAEALRPLTGDTGAWRGSLSNALAALFDEGGSWITLKGGRHIHLDAEGKPTGYEKVTAEDEPAPTGHPSTVAGAVKKSTPKAGYHHASEEEREALKLPPRWVDVHVANDPNAARIATGKDEAGRTQRRYSAAHTAKAKISKFARGKDFHEELPGLRARIQKDFKDGNEEAAVLRLLDTRGFRIGSDADTKAKVKAYGASTLRAEHLKIEGDTIHLDFTGKKGVSQAHTIKDAELAREMEKRAKGGGRLFNTSDAKVRDYLHSIDGQFKVKDFRTWHGTAAAKKAIEGMAAPTTTKELEAAKTRVAEIASERLGNKPAEALKSYIDPHVFSDWEHHVSQPASMSAFFAAMTAKAAREADTKTMDEFYETHSYDKLPTPKEYFEATGDENDDEQEDRSGTLRSGEAKAPKMSLADSLAPLRR